jgi:hypothetical protein
MRVVPAQHGWGWIVAGWQLFRPSPGMWTLLVFCYWMLVATVDSVRYIGPVVVALSLPGFSVSFMVLCETARRGERLQPMLLFAGFRQRTVPLLILGVLYLVSIVLVVAATAIVDGGLMFDWMVWNRPPPPETLADGRLMKALLTASVLALPVLTAFWFAPILTAWNGMSPAKGLFFSFFGCWRNWRAMLTYGAAVALLGFMITLLIALLGAAAGGNIQAARGMMLGATLMLMPTLFGSFFAAYKDIFPEPEPATQPAQENT